VLELPAHVANLGIIFYTGNMFPAEYQNQIFIAEHGSWNRSKKIGYQVIWVKIQNNKALSWQPFVSGWLQDEHAWGRPVALLVMPDGAMLISDDTAGAIYRVSYAKPAP
jgi:glucose/arabinose dehydrogenase